MSPSGTPPGDIADTTEQHEAPAASSAPSSSSKGPPSAVEFEPPLACVRRILKHTLPSSTNVGKDASAAFARASGIFIIYVTACANDFARENRRQTITANDVLAAIKELEFDEFTPELTDFLERYRTAERSKKVAKAKAAAAAKAGGGDEEEDDVAEGESKVETPQSSKGDGGGLGKETPSSPNGDQGGDSDEEREDGPGEEDDDDHQAEGDEEAMGIDDVEDEEEDELEEMEE